MRKSGRKILYWIILGLGVLTIIQFFTGDLKYNALNQSKLHHLTLEGTFYTDKDRNPKKITEKGIQSAGDSEYLTVTGHLNENIGLNEQVFIYLRRISVKVYKNGELIYDYGGVGTHLPIVRSAGNIWGSFFSDEITTEDEITIQFHNPYPQNSKKVYLLSMQRLYSGDKMQLFLHMSSEIVHTNVFCLLMLLLGAELLIISWSFKILHMRDHKAIFYCGILFMVADIWLLIDYSYISLLFPYGMTVDVIDTLMLLAIPTIAIRYSQSYVLTGVKRFLVFLETILLLITIEYLILQQVGFLDSEIMQEVFMRFLPVLAGIIFVCLVIEVKHNPNKTARVVLVSGILLDVCGIVGYICFEITDVYGSEFFGVGLILFIVIQYVVALKNIQSMYQIWTQSKEIEKELMESRIAIMLSQIQPHFLYNSISSIQELCLSEPQKAYDALAKFAHFLRGNMDSLTSSTPITIEQELRHVKNYLALEKIRFEERLRVEYEIEEGGFFIPALTIQPIVENAVRYGISKKKDGGIITISTRRTKEGYVVTIADDGEGFDLALLSNGRDGRSHIGMENVRKRLKAQCGGRLEISSSSEGTVARIILPEN